MKKMKLLSIIGALLCGAIINSQAQFATYTNLIAPQVIINSVTGKVLAVSVTLPSQYYQVFTGPITNAPNYVTNIVGSTTNIFNTITNSQPVRFVASIDGSTFMGVGLPTNYPPGTNSLITPVNLIGKTFTLYLAPVMDATNTLPGAVLKQQ